MHSAYVHIPFCDQICSYCDFVKFKYTKKFTMQYLDALKAEITTNYQHEVLDTLYIGGGTPSSLDYDELRYLLDMLSMIKLSDNYEYTIEANPESLDEEKLQYQ